MALTTCPYCGGAVSTSAVQCPHCGQALKIHAPEPVSQQQVTEPVQQPEPQLIQLTKSKLESILMLFLGLVPLLLLGIQRLHYADDSMSLDFHKAVFGCMMSYASLYFLIQIFKDKANQFVASMCFVLAMFLMITNLYAWGRFDLAENAGWRWIIENYDYFSIAFGFSMMLYAGTVNNWSGIVLLASGVIWVATVTWRPHNGVAMSELLADHTVILLGVVLGICLLSMMIFWTMDSSNASKNQLVRIASGVAAVLVAATIVILAVSAKDIMEAEKDKGLEAVVLPMIIMMITGAVSLVLTLLLAKDNKLLLVASALYMSIAMFLVLGYHFEYNSYAHTYAYWDDAFREKLANQMRDLFYSARFLLPISIMMTYVAKEASAITERIFTKIQ